MPATNLPKATLCIPVDGDPPERVLLGYKKTGFGRGKYGGFGGKVEMGEGIVDATIREMWEETSLKVRESDFDYVARLSFIFPFKMEWGQEVYAFLVSSWEGIPKESDEMKPEWFEVSSIPFERMWQDGRVWMPLILSGRRICATFTFEKDNETLATVDISDLKEN